MSIVRKAVDPNLFIYFEDDLGKVPKKSDEFYAFRGQDIEEILSSGKEPKFLSSWFSSQPWIWEGRLPFHLKKIEMEKNLNLIKMSNISYILSSFASGSNLGWRTGVIFPNKEIKIPKLVVKGNRHGFITEVGSLVSLTK